MIVIIKSAPDTSEGRRGLKLARDMGADIILIQNAVYIAQKERLDGIAGNVYILEEDRKLRGLKDDEIQKNLKRLNYDSLVDLMADNDSVIGMF